MATGTLPPGFNGLQYIASYPDLIQSLGANRAAGEQHYLTIGQAEGRAPDTFDLLRYLDNNPDVAGRVRHQRRRCHDPLHPAGLLRGPERRPAGGAAAGVQRAAVHRLLPRPDPEPRRRPLRRRAALPEPSAKPRAVPPDTFDLARYLDNNPDVAAAFGSNSSAATIHYIEQGFFEGRNDDPPAGAAAPLRRAAVHRLPSRPDPGAGRRPLRRRAALPRRMGRPRAAPIDTFDAVRYLDNNPDVEAALGTSSTAAATHYIQFGFAEGRTDDPPPGLPPGSTGCSTSPPTPT